MLVSWDEYKTIVCNQMQDYRKFIYRGQSNSDWALSTTIHRTGRLTTHQEFVSYFTNILPFVQEPIEAWDGSRRDLSDPLQLASFLAFLQHNSFPTPLLDWTLSPFIAAYFAFEGVNHFSPQYEKVAIYTFNQEAWITAYKQVYDYEVEDAYITPLRPTYRGNPKQMLQQGIFIFTNQSNIEGHIQHNEKTPGQFLHKYEISVKERSKIFNELNAMNITAMQLAPSIESVCKKAFEEVCIGFEMGLSPNELKKLLDSFSAYNPS